MTLADNGGPATPDGYTGSLEASAVVEVARPSAAELEALVRDAGYDGSPSSEDDFFSAGNEEGWRLSITYRDWAESGPTLLLVWSSPRFALWGDAAVQAKDAG